MDVIRTQGDINGLKAAKAANPTEKDVKVLRNSDAYKKAMESYGTGSDMQRAGQAVTGALQALAGNNLAGALASGAAPYLAREIKARIGDDNVAANAMAHAVLGAITAQLNNQSAVAGAVGAGGGELVARVILSEMFQGRKISDLTESEKQQVSALSQLAAGLAGGLVSDSTAGVVTGSQAAKNAVENNALSVSDNKSRSQEMTQCQGLAACESTVIEKYKKINAEQRESVVECKGAQNCVDKANEVGKVQTDYANRTNELLEKARANGGLSSEEQNELSILQVTTIQLEADRNAAIHNALMSGDSSEAKQLAINSLAQVAGTSAAGIAAGIGKAKAGSQTGNRIEQILKPEKSWEGARNKALSIVGNLGSDSKPVIGRLEVSAGNGKVIGRQSNDGKIGWRVDYDPEKGTHINIWDYSQGKGPGKAIKQVVPFEGNEKSFETILKQLNR
jgi:filamentous hemagglutinin